MKTITSSFEYNILYYNELSDTQKQLVDQARKATYRSYAPYSNFKVGAAILLSNGVIVDGANQENAALPAGTCAERSACFYAGAEYPDAKFKAIAIAARDASDDFIVNPISPCGVCRQALLEYENKGGKPVEVLLIGRDKIYSINSIRDLLPFAFTEF
ncbi:MAG: cytidine deaminase [Muribaculaceae bacterium]|nr:cytidine deaminase [Muribaculaceae bacterium]